MLGRKYNCSNCLRPLSVFLAGTKIFDEGSYIAITCPNCKKTNTYINARKRVLFAKKKDSI